VIIGDANMSEVATYLKCGVTAIVLMMIEDEAVSDEWALDNPVQALHQISHDVSCTRTVKLKDGRAARAVDVQWGYHEMARKYLMHHDAPSWTADVMLRWEETLNTLERDPMELERQLDWVAKYRVLERYREKHELEWADPRLHLLDLQYHDVRQDRGIAHVLVRQGKLERLVEEDEIQRAVDAPPVDTRAYFRGRCLAQFAQQVAAASWDSVIFDLGADALQRVPMHEPLRGTESMVKDLLDASRSANDLLQNLKG
jgi:proteasome accessory factor A